MPPINEYKCSKCGFALPEGWGVYLYVEDGNGNRILCPHPEEERAVAEVLGSNASIELIQERTGFSSDCVCLDCLHQFELDLGESDWSPYEHRITRRKREKDKRECPKCKSKNVRTVLELVGEACPKCKEGIIEEIFTGAIC